MVDVYDFSGWATKADLKCTDGRTIIKDAFKHHDGAVVPLVWNHQHNDPNNVLGHAILEHREEGIYAYGVFNDTESGKNAKLLVQHADVDQLSIYANQLKEVNKKVMHGMIREVSLVLAGANPGAFIDSVIVHGDESGDAGVIYTGEYLEMYHSEDSDKETIMKEEPKKNVKDTTEELEHADTAGSDGEETVADVFNTLSEKQKNVVYAMIGQALEEGAQTNSEGGSSEMKQNVFDQDEKDGGVIAHSDMMAVITDAKRYGSMKESALQHGITDVDYLFPDAANITATPQFIQRDMGWVRGVMAAVHKSPFSRIKSMFADITADAARAKGYIKGNLKIEEVFTLLKRTTTPVTIYKKQKMDRDDVIDITDFDVVAWLKAEMRMMLDEEIARAILVGDGRLGNDDEKINEGNIRPVWTDADLYTIKTLVTVAETATADQRAKAAIRAAIKARKDYKGSGSLTFYTTEDFLTDCLLLEDSMGRVIYDSVDKLATALRVKEIVTVPVMEGLTRTVLTATHQLLGIFVNLADYNIGADKGGAVNMFDDFDIDYNAQKYLIETRCSGALTKPYSAIALELTETEA